jgi:metal-sulfur cluster biosynthetic enzyme
MPLNEETVMEALRQVKDPELLVNVVDLGLIYGVGVDEADGKSNVMVLMTLTTPACPWGPELLREVKDTLGRLEGIGQVEVKLTLNPPWTPDRMTEDARDELGLYE